MVTQRAWKIFGLSVFWTVIYATLLCVIAAICVWLFYVRPMHADIHRCDQGFATITRGMTASEVTAAMGQPHRINRSGKGHTLTSTSEGCNDLATHPSDTFDFEYVYTMKTFFLPKDWVVGFDKEGKVVAKHCYD